MCYQKLKIETLICIIFIIFYSCTNKNGSLQQRKIGSDIVEASFINDAIEGQAKYYNKSHMLVGTAFFKNGIKNGPAVNFWPNRQLKDSMFYKNGLLNGECFGFDTTGKIFFQRYAYYGLSMGPNFLYHNGKLREFYYTDFEKNDMIYCTYDSLGKCRINSFNSKPILTEILNEDRINRLDLFLYLLRPPKVSINYIIGLTNNKHEIKNEILINSNHLFFDTTLEYAESGWWYYLSTKVKNLDDSTEKTYIDYLKIQ